MPRELKIKMRVPVPGRVAQESCIVFNEWLPASDETIATAAGGISVRLWLDSTCLAHLDKPTPEKIRRMVNVKVGSVLVDVSVVGVQEELETYIFAGKNSSAQQEHQNRLQADYDELGHQILRCVLGALNRLFAFARSVKGQYWLGDYEIRPDRLPSDFVQFAAKILTPDGKWQDFIPGTTIHLGGSSICSPERFLKQEDWRRAGEYVASEKGEPLVGTLLANAEALADQDHTRSAMIEAVTALEVALNAFAARPRLEDALLKPYAERLGLKSLKDVVEHLGFTASWTYVVPLILRAPALPSEVVRGCCEAIRQRQNIVHRGQRTVKANIMMRSLHDIRTACKVLSDLTELPDQSRNRNAVITRGGPKMK
jgi:hypothetical protein